MIVHQYGPYQSDPNCNHSSMTCRSCLKIPSNVYGIDASIDNKMLKPTHILLVRLETRKRGIGTLKKYRGYIFSEFCTKNFKEKLLHYINVVIFEMVKTALKDTYLVGTTPTALQNEVSSLRKNYYERETWVMVNHSVNEFYTPFLFKIDPLPQDLVFPLYIAATFFNNFSPYVREFLIS